MGHPKANYINEFKENLYEKNPLLIDYVSGLFIRKSDFINLKQQQISHLKGKDKLKAELLLNAELSLLFGKQ